VKTLLTGVDTIELVAKLAIAPGQVKRLRSAYRAQRAGEKPKESKDVPALAKASEAKRRHKWNPVVLQLGKYRICVKRTGKEDVFHLSCCIFDGLISLNGFEEWAEGDGEGKAPEGNGIKFRFFSHALMMLGPAQCVALANEIIGWLSSDRKSNWPHVPMEVTRLDLFKDKEMAVEEFSLETLLGRSRVEKQAYYVGTKLTGFTVGHGVVRLRIYDKRYEVMFKSPEKAEDLLAKYEENGWTPGEPVTRIEIQFRKGALKEFYTATGRRQGQDWGRMLDPSYVITCAPALWKYATHKWLRHVEKSDARRTRWKTSAIWKDIQRGDFQVMPGAPEEVARYQRKGKLKASAVIGYVRTYAMHRGWRLGDIPEGLTPAEKKRWAEEQTERMFWFASKQIGLDVRKMGAGKTGFCAAAYMKQKANEKLAQVEAYESGIAPMPTDVEHMDWEALERQQELSGKTVPFVDHERIKAIFDTDHVRKWRERQRFRRYEPRIN